jgi:hypothetical protein
MGIYDIVKADGREGQFKCWNRGLNTLHKGDSVPAIDGSKTYSVKAEDYDGGGGYLNIKERKILSWTDAPKFHRIFDKWGEPVTMGQMEWNPKKAKAGEIWVAIDPGNGHFGVYEILVHGTEDRWPVAESIGFCGAKEWSGTKTKRDEFGAAGERANTYYLRIDDVRAYAETLPREGMIELFQRGLV